jgi:regulator of cell morphogenesis and NO signaling
MSTTERTLRDIVTENFNTASVLEKYGLDFCCKGGVTLEEACKAKGLNRGKVAAELSEVIYEESSQRYFQWELPFLIDYILNNHHSYVKNQIPLINLHLEKVVSAHGDRHPEVKEVEGIFHEQSQALGNHMMKEEKILFPFIKQLAESHKIGNELPIAQFGSVSAPIAVMLAEHDDVGNALAHIRELLLDYTPPNDACTTMRLLYHELDAFEHDLHKHVFLENAILFPKATRMEKEFAQAKVVQL